LKTITGQFGLVVYDDTNAFARVSPALGQGTTSWQSAARLYNAEFSFCLQSSLHEMLQ
jgi:hypothetical protein